MAWSSLSWPFNWPWSLLSKSGQNRNVHENDPTWPEIIQFCDENSDSDDEVFDEKKLYSWRNSSKGKKEVFSIARTVQSQILILSQSPYGSGPTYGCHWYWPVFFQREKWAVLKVKGLAVWKWTVLTEMEQSFECWVNIVDGQYAKSLDQEVCLAARQRNKRRQGQVVYFELEKERK